MGVAMEAQAARREQQDVSAVSAKHIVFFDVETNVPSRACRTYELLEFGAVVLDARGLGELHSFHTLIRPKDLSCIDGRTTDCNTITLATVAEAPLFKDVADDIYQLLHGNIWAGHNILRFDILRINEAFSNIGQPAPQPAGVVDTYPLLRKTFGKRAGNYKLATLANYCGFGKQEHRSIADVRMNIDVLRSCATLLFLESNYPDIFLAQMEISTSTSELEQSASFATFVNDHDAQVADSQVQLSNKAEDSCSASRPVQLANLISSRIDACSKGLKDFDSLRGSGLSRAFIDLTVGQSQDTWKEDRSSFDVQTCSSFSRAASENEQRVMSKAGEAYGVLRSRRTGEEVLMGFETESENRKEVPMGFETECEITMAVEAVDINSAKVERLVNSGDAEEIPMQKVSVTTSNLAINKCLVNEIDQDLSQAIYSLSLQSGPQDEAASGRNILEVESSSMSEICKSGSIPAFEGLPFLLASHVDLPFIEVREESSFRGSIKVLYYKGFPLHLLEFNIRVRFTINTSYAFDDKGKPRFSILIEPSEAACNVIRRCEDLVKSMTVIDNEVEWLPALRKESGCWATRMSIGTRWMESSAVYVTEFFHDTRNGLEKFLLGDVDALGFKNVLPHGSVIDTGFGFYVFNVNNRAGVRLLAKHITLH